MQGLSSLFEWFKDPDNRGAVQALAGVAAICAAWATGLLRWLVGAVRGKPRAAPRKACEWTPRSGGVTLDIPGGERLVSEFYAQLSKFSTWIVSILQQVQPSSTVAIRPTVFGNAKQFFFHPDEVPGDRERCSRRWVVRRDEGCHFTLPAS